MKLQHKIFFTSYKTIQQVKSRQVDRNQDRIDRKRDKLIKNKVFPRVFVTITKKTQTL